MRSTSQVVAVILAVLLLIPGGCFLALGSGLALGGVDFGSMMIGGVILLPAELLFWVAFRRKRPPNASRR